MCYCARLPVELRREEFCNQVLVIWSKFFNVAGLVAFGVEIIRVEGANGFEGCMILFIHEVCVGSLTVPSK